MAKKKPDEVPRELNIYVKHYGENLKNNNNEHYMQHFRDHLVGMLLILFFTRILFFPLALICKELGRQNYLVVMLTFHNQVSGTMSVIRIYRLAMPSEIF